MIQSHKLLWGAVVLSLVSSTALWGYTLMNKSGGSDAQIEAWVKKNPGVIFQAVQEHLQTQQTAGLENAGEALKANSAFLYEADHPVIGNPNGDVAIVEFLDYNCGYCKRAYGPLMELVAKDTNVKLILIEIPILSDTSALAAHWALAAHEIDDTAYKTFHKSLMTHQGPISEEILTGFAKDAGLNPTDVKAKAQTEEITSKVNLNLQKSAELTISGTPGFIIGDEIIRGYVELPALEAAVAKAREAK